MEKQKKRVFEKERSHKGIVTLLIQQEIYRRKAHSGRSRTQASTKKNVEKRTEMFL